MAGHGGCTQTPEQYAKPRKRKANSKLTMIRMSMGLTQKQLAEMVGVQQATIAMMEKKEALGIKQAQKVSAVIGIDWKELV